MKERLFRGREHEELEDVASERLLEKYLEAIAPFIGWIVIYFNSLEDSVTFCLRDQMLRDPYQDERLGVFLSEMMYAAKCRSLTHLYGQALSATSGEVTSDELTALSKTLEECGKRRNEYAHADWIGLKKERYVRVKTSSGKSGLSHRYKKYTLRQLRSDVSYIERARHELETFNERITNQIWGRTSA